MDNKKNVKQKLGLSAEKWTEELWSRVIEKLAKTSSPEEIRKILENLMSEYERKMILKRLAVIAMVRSGKSYSQISEVLWLAPNTISTIKKNILGQSGNYKSYRKFYGGPKKWSGEIKHEDPFWTQVLDFLETVPKYGRAKTPNIDDVRRMRRARERKKKPWS